MVDSLSQMLVVSRLFRFLERADVPDVRDGVAFTCRTACVDFVVFIVSNDILLPLGVQDPSLVGIAGAFVGGGGYDGDVLFVGYVVASELSVSSQTCETWQNTHIVNASSLYP